MTSSPVSTALLGSVRSDWTTLNAQVDTMVRRLACWGIEEGNCVVTVLSNHELIVIMFWACVQRNVTLSLFDPSLGASRLRDIIRQNQPGLVVIDRAVEHWLGVAARIPGARLAVFDDSRDLLHITGAQAFSPLAQEPVAARVETRSPKPIVTEYVAPLSSIRRMADQRVVFHAGSLATEHFVKCMAGIFRKGAKLGFLRKVTVLATLARLEETRATHLFTTRDFLCELTANPFLDQNAFRDLRSLALCDSSLNEELRQRVRKRFSESVITDVSSVRTAAYGTTCTFTWPFFPARLAY